MPENNHEVIIDGYVYPDTVTITLANDDFVGSRDYVSKDLYESVDGANDYWQAENAKLREERDGWKKLCTDQEVMHVMHEETLDNENAKLRELVRAAWRCIHTGASCSDCRLIAGGCTLQSAMRELRIEVEQ